VLLRNLSGRWLRSRAAPGPRGTLSRSTLVGFALTAVLVLASCTASWEVSEPGRSTTTSTPQRPTTTRPTTTTTRRTTVTTAPATTTTITTTTTAPPTTTTTTTVRTTTTVLSGWPNTDNTGPPPDQQPCTTTINGNFEVPGPGFVMDRYCINNGSIVIGVGDDNLRVTNSVIRSVGFAGGFVANDNLRGAVIEDSEIDCQLAGGASGISGGNYTGRRVEIRNCENGLSLQPPGGVVFTHSLIHQLKLGGGAHADGVQGTGADNVLFERNFVNAPNASSAYQFHSNTGAQNDNVTVRYNKLLGGSYTVYLPGANPACQPPNPSCGPWTGNQFYGNRLDNGFFGLCAGDPDSIAVWGAETGNYADRNVDDSSGAEICT
jgi:hypothetical protein